VIESPADILKQGMALSIEVYEKSLKLNPNNIKAVES
jgi:hypothetical protein